MISIVQTYLSRRKQEYPRPSCTETTVGIATTISVPCPIHQKLFQTSNVRTNMERMQRNTSVSYMGNCSLVLAVQYFGGGGSECDLIIYFLRLPHAGTFGSNTFNRIEKLLHPIINTITQQSLSDALEEEVKQQLEC